MKREIDNKVSDLRKEFEADLDDISEKLSQVTDQINSSGASHSRDSNEKKFNIVVRKLPVTVNENLDNKINALIKDGLKIRDIVVKSAERKQSYNESVPGVVVATLSSLNDKKRLIVAKASLKDNRQYNTSEKRAYDRSERSGGRHY